MNVFWTDVPCVSSIIFLVEEPADLISLAAASYITDLHSEANLAEESKAEHGSDEILSHCVMVVVTVLL